MNWIILGLSAVVLAFASALRAAGASLVRTPRADALHDAAEGDENAARVAELLEDRARLQPALGMVHSALLVAAAVPATWSLAVLTKGWAMVIALSAMAVVLVLVGDVVPRSWGRNHPRRLAYRFSTLLERAVMVGDAAADLIQDEDEDEDEEAPEDADDTAEKELISSVLEFTDAVVREVMVPRPDMSVIAADADTDAAREMVIAEGRSRLPVTGQDIDDIVGILYAKDLLGLLGEPQPVRSLLRPAYFVPETKRLSELLREMQANQVHLAIAVDEFGGTAGLISIEDILEELVGEIVDEYDTEETMVTPLDDGGYMVDARLSVDDLADLVEAQFPDEEWETVGGLVLALAGRVPREGESFEYEQFLLTADRVQGRRVARVRVHHR